MTNEYSVDYHPSPPGLTPSIHPLIFLYTPYSLCVSRRSVEFSGEPIYSNMVGKNFQIYDIHITKKMHLWVKKLNLDIFNYTPWQNSLQILTTHPQ